MKWYLKKLNEMISWGQGVWYIMCHRIGGQSELCDEWMMNEMNEWKHEMKWNKIKWHEMLLNEIKLN